MAIMFGHTSGLPRARRLPPLLAAGPNQPSGCPLPSIPSIHLRASAMIFSSFST